MWPCFIIVEHERRVERIVGHDSRHRSVVEVYRGMDFDDHPALEDVEWPEICPEPGCEYVMDYEGDHSFGWRTFMGTCSWRRDGTDEVRDDQYHWGPGAMYDATEWSPKSWRGPDGRCWAIVLPPASVADYWLIDGEASSGGRWSRTGSPPNVSVTPSIATPNYHGFLGSNGAPPGYLSDDLEGRRY